MGALIVGLAAWIVDAIWSWVARHVRGGGASDLSWLDGLVFDDEPIRRH